MSTDLNSKQLNTKKLEDSDYFEKNHEYFEDSINSIKSIHSINKEEGLNIFSDSNNNTNREPCKFSEINKNIRFNRNNIDDGAYAKYEQLIILDRQEKKERNNHKIKHERNKLLAIPCDWNKTQEDPQCLIKGEDFHNTTLIPSKILNIHQQNTNPQIPQKSNSFDSSIDDPRINNISEDSTPQVKKIDKYISNFFKKHSNSNNNIQLKNQKLFKYNSSESKLPKFQRSFINLPSTARNSLESRWTEFGKNKIKKLEFEKKRLYIKNFSECTFTPKVNHQNNREKGLFFLLNLQNVEDGKIDNNNCKNLQNLKNCKNLNLNLNIYNSNPTKIRPDNARVADNSNKIWLKKNSERIRKNFYSDNQMLLNENSFTPKISNKSKLMLRLEGIENILYNDAKRRQQKKIEIDLINNSPKLKYIKKFIKNKNNKNKNKKNEEMIINSFSRQFNNTLKELKISSDNLEKSQLKMVLDRLGITNFSFSNKSEELFEKTWNLLNNSNKVSNLNLLKLFSIAFGYKSNLNSKEDSKLCNSSSNNGSLGKLNEKGEYVTTLNEEIMVQKYFKHFQQNYLGKSTNSKKCQNNPASSLDFNRSLGQKKSCPSFKLFETLSQKKNSNISQPFEINLNSTLKDIRKEKAISIKNLKHDLISRLVNSNRKLDIKVHPIQENLSKLRNQKSNLDPARKSKKENIQVSKCVSFSKFENAKKIFNSKIKIIEESKKKCPFKPSINNYKKQQSSPSLPKNASYQIERLRKAYEEKERIKKGTIRIEGSTAFKIGNGWDKVSKIKVTNRQTELDQIKNSIRKNNAELTETNNNPKEKQSRISDSIDLSESNSFPIQPENKILFFIDVEFGNNIKERIALKEGDNINKKIHNLAITNTLQNNEKQNLIQIINSKIGGILDSIAEESKTSD